MRVFRAAAFYAALAVIYYIKVFGGYIAAPGDGITEFYPLRFLAAGLIKGGEFPFWLEHMFAGFPLMASMQTGLLYPVNLLPMLILPPVWAFNLSLMLHSVMAALFMYLYVRLIGAWELPALCAGVVYGFMGFMAFNIIHPPMQHGAAWLPLVLYSLERLRRGPGARWIVLCAFAVAMQALAGHPQILVQGLILYIAYVIVFSIKRPAFLAYGLGSVALGLMFAAPQLLPAHELVGLALRRELSYETFSSISMPLHMLPAMLFPFLWGGGYSGAAYWGPPSLVTGQVGFAGVLALVVAAYTAIAKRKEPLVLFWSAAAVAALALSLGSNVPPLNRLIYNVPVLNLFRSSINHMMEADFALSVLMAVGLTAAVKWGGGEGRKGNYSKRPAVILLVFAAVSVLLGLSIPALAAEWKRLSITLPSVYVPVLFMVMYATVLLVMNKRKSWASLTGVALVALIFFEALSLRSSHLGTWPSTAAIEAEQGSALYSRLQMSGDRAAIVFHSRGTRKQQLLPITRGVRLLNGDDPLIPKDLSDLLDMEAMGYSHAWERLLENNIILSMLNTKYIVVPDDMSPLMDALRGRPAEGVESHGGLGPHGGGGRFVPPISTALPAGGGYERIYERLSRGPWGVLYENRNVLPPVFSVTRLIEAKGVEDVKRKLYGFRADPAREALLSADDIGRIGASTFGSAGIKLKERRSGRITFTTQSSDRAFVVISEQHYPGWRAYLDGRRVDLYKADGVLMGVVAPPGRHEVVLQYVPRKFYAGLLVFAAGAVLLAALWFAERHRRA